MLLMASYICHENVIKQTNLNSIQCNGPIIAILRFLMGFAPAAAKEWDTVFLFMIKKGTFAFLSTHEGGFLYDDGQCEGTTSFEEK